MIPGTKDVIPEFPNVFGFLSLHMSFIMVSILAIFFIVYCVFTGILLFHWSSYGMKSFSIKIAEILFIGFSAVLFFVSILAIYYF